METRDSGLCILWIMYVLSLNFLTINGITTERYLIVRAANLNQHQDTLTLKFGSKDIYCFGKTFCFCFHRK